MATIEQEPGNKYRYRLWHLGRAASSLPAVGSLTVQNQARILEAEFGIDKDTFMKDMYAAKGGGHVMPETRLHAYATFYNVPTTQLLNSAPLPGRSLTELVKLQERRSSSLVFALDSTPQLQPTHA